MSALRTTDLVHRTIHGQVSAAAGAIGAQSERTEAGIGIDREQSPSSLCIVPNILDKTHERFREPPFARPVTQRAVFVERVWGSPP